MLKTFEGQNFFWKQSIQGCKRILISDEYYDRMNDSHFKLDNTAILEINEEPFVFFLLKIINILICTS